MKEIVYDYAFNEKLIVVCSKLINASIKGTIDERAINKGANLNTFKITENQNLCINSAKVKISNPFIFIPIVR